MMLRTGLFALVLLGALSTEVVGQPTPIDYATPSWSAAWEAPVPLFDDGELLVMPTPSRTGAAFRGLGKGLLIGAGVGVALGLLIPEPSGCDWFCGRGERAVLLGVAGGVWGGIGGFAYGLIRG